MKRIVRLDCSAGLSIDMAAGALIDLLEDSEGILEELRFLTNYGIKAEITEIEKYGQRCIDFCISPREQGHIHRQLKDVKAILSQCELSQSAGNLACQLYQRIAEAEATVHHTTVDQVHFHEVGSLSTIASIIAFSSAYTRLHIEELQITSLTEGTGIVHCSHGELEVPVPAVRELLANYPLPLLRAEGTGELITPSAAAVISLLGIPSHGTLHVLKKGYGAGKRNTGLRGYVIGELGDLEESISDVNQLRIQDNKWAEEGKESEYDVE
ncbi:MAG: DUF111 family protein [Solobacterium sp.]|nr:DUF111 family protein [Solobacterium sp.]